jgi:hypothetical protein
LSSLKTGTAPILTLEVCISAVPHTRAGHECRGSIPPVARFVHVCVAEPKEPMQLRACIYAHAVTLRWSFAPVAIAATSTVRKVAQTRTGAARNMRPDSDINQATVVVSDTLREPGAIARDKRK